jgi:hypothetical protein
MLRTDFVSNSSSSSFVLLGKIYYYENLISDIEKSFPTIIEDINNFYKEKGYTTQYKTLYDIPIYDIINFIAIKNNAKNIECEWAGYDNEITDVCIGIRPSNMKDDETFGDFKLKVEKELNKLNIPNSTHVNFVHGGQHGCEKWFG